MYNVRDISVLYILWGRYLHTNQKSSVLQVNCVDKSTINIFKEYHRAR